MAIKAFTQAAIAIDTTIGPFNSAPIVAAELIDPSLALLAAQSASTSEEKKAKKDALQKIILIFLGRLTRNGRELYTSLIAKETPEILEKLVTIPGKLNKWIDSDVLTANIT